MLYIRFYKIKLKQIIFEHKHMDGLFIVGVKYNELSNKLLSIEYKKINQNNEKHYFSIRCIIF